MTVGLSSLDKPYWPESCHAEASFVKVLSIPLESIAGVRAYVTDT
jgi:hypothetical protein